MVPAITTPSVVAWRWSPVVLAGLGGYYLLRALYLRRGRELAALYRPVAGVPVPMAVLPVVALLATGAWLSNVWIAGAAVVLAAGHIPSAVLTAQTINGARDEISSAGH